jgi:hypothetical protein
MSTALVEATTQRDADRVIHSAARPHRKRPASGSTSRGAALSPSLRNRSKAQKLWAKAPASSVEP